MTFALSSKEITTGFFGSVVETSVWETGKIGCQAPSLTRQAGCQPAPGLFRQAGSLPGESAERADIRLRCRPAVTGFLPNQSRHKRCARLNRRMVESSDRQTSRERPLNAQLPILHHL